MLGNFSFGDYFKKDAIAYAWELMTSPEWFAIPKDKLYVTIFGGAEISPGNMLEIDMPAGQCWLAEQVPQERIHAIAGLKDNFWAMGDTGPCGPCSEIFYDMGPTASEEGHADCKFPCDCGRYVEIWNLVFMQFNRDASGVLSPLPKPCVDTGMGLERVAAVLQGVISNYDTDFFVPLMKRAAELCGVDLAREEKLEEGKGGAASLRVIADHARAATFLISDGVLPGNGKREYVLRRIIRRAIWHGRLLGQDQPFLHLMVHEVSKQMNAAYPETVQQTARISNSVLAEEHRFARTIKAGLPNLEFELKQEGRELLRAELQHLAFQPTTLQKDAIFQGNPMPAAENVSFPVERAIHFHRAYGVELGTIVDALRAQTNSIKFDFEEFERRLKGKSTAPPTPKQAPEAFSGAKAFAVYETYGLPRDFIEDVLRDRGLFLDSAGFERAAEEQRTRARASWKGGAKEAANPAYARLAETFRTELDFYFGTTAKDSRIEAIITKNGPVNELKAGESGEVVLDRTAIYAESGGQVADTGEFYDNSESQLLAEVTGAFYPVAGLVAHKVVAKETLRVGDRVAVVADAERRARIIRNHSGTHLVNAALRNILGTHVKQAGSLNAPERLRFDFSHFAHVDAEELRDIEQQVNDEIRLNTEIETNVTSLEEALASGALAFFGDKYPEHNVRVVTIPDPRAARGFYSKELCGGTHVQRVGDIGVLKIVSEESVAAGVRRIEAVTGIGALEHYQQQAQILGKLASQLNVGEDGILAQVEKLAQTAKQLEKELEAQKRKGALSQIDELAGRVQLVKGIKVIAAEVQNVDREGLRQLVDSLRQKLGSGVVALGMPEDGKVALIAGVTKDLTAKVHAGKLIQALAKQVGGSGGGRPDLAEAGGKDTTGLKMALESVPSLLEPLL
jgi:alanyl-tRNA synthetase